MRSPIKKIDQYVLMNFLMLFIATFFISILVLLMQFVWLHVKDLVGKGVDLSVLAEFFVYAVANVIPMALPLAILLASLLTFGALGENVELTAMKAAGISLFRIIRPLTIALSFAAIFAFYFSNNILPKSQVKLWTLIFSLRQKSPELDIPEGEFYDGIDGYHLYVRHKDKRHNLLKDLMIYDYTKGFQDVSVMVADSGRLFASMDKKYLKLELFNGETFENLNQGQQRATSSQKNIPYSRESFEKKTILIDFSTEFARYDESILNDQHVSKNVAQLIQSIDSVHQLAHERSREQSAQLIKYRYFGRERMEGRSLIPVDKSEAKYYDIDSLYQSLTLRQKRAVHDIAADKAVSQSDQIEYNSLLLQDNQVYVRRHEIELHRKFTLAFACLIFFFIGAPLGAIIQKGGLGTSTVTSVLLFVAYYIVDNTGYKMAREALWPTWLGMWLSSLILLPIGVFLTYKAATDSSLFNRDAWAKAFHYVRFAALFSVNKVRKFTKARFTHSHSKRITNK